MKKKEWKLSIMQNPPSFHFCVTDLHTKEICIEFCKDLKKACEDVSKRDNQKLEGTLAIYGAENNLEKGLFINEIIKHNAGEEESKKLLIYFAIKNLKWDIARENVLGMIGSNPSKDICYFMSDIELGENNDKQKSDAWIMRAENAKLENSWICRITNQSQEEWSSLSNSGNYNSLVWTSPMMIRQNIN